MRQLELDGTTENFGDSETKKNEQYGWFQRHTFDRGTWTVTTSKSTRWTQKSAAHLVVWPPTGPSSFNTATTPDDAGRRRRWNARTRDLGRTPAWRRSSSRCTFHPKLVGSSSLSSSSTSAFLRHNSPPPIKHFRFIPLSLVPPPPISFLATQKVLPRSTIESRFWIRWF